MVTIGIDPHKDTHTAVAVEDATGVVLDEVTVVARDHGHQQLVRWADRYARRCWALEDCRHVSGRLERALLARGEAVVRVPPKMMGESRRGERTWGKSDTIDATAVARAALRDPNLDRGRLAPATRRLRLLTDRRDDVVAERTRESNRLRWLLHDLDPGLRIAARKFAYGPAVRRARQHLAAFDGDDIAVQIALELLDRIEQLTATERRYAVQIRDLVRRDYGYVLDLPGCGELTAAKLLGEIGDITRFASDAKLAMHAGVAPIPVSSGRSNRVRLNRRGNRQLNVAIHRIAITQLACHPPARAFVERRRRDGKSTTEAIRALKRHITRAAYNVLSQADTAPT